MNPIDINSQTDFTFLDRYWRLQPLVNFGDYLTAIVATFIVLPIRYRVGSGTQSKWLWSHNIKKIDEHFQECGYPEPCPFHIKRSIYVEAMEESRSERLIN